MMCILFRPGADNERGDVELLLTKRCALTVGWRVVYGLMLQTEDAPRFCSWPEKPTHTN
jgi:hypothetical protein